MNIVESLEILDLLYMSDKSKSQASVSRESYPGIDIEHQQPFFW